MKYDAIKINYIIAHDGKWCSDKCEFYQDRITKASCALTNDWLRMDENEKLLERKFIRTSQCLKSQVLFERTSSKEEQETAKQLIEMSLK